MIRRGLLFWILVVILVSLTVTAARAGDKTERFTALEENDSLYFNTDRHFTQGLRLSYTGPEVGDGSGWNDPFDFLGGIPTVFADGGKRRYAVILGQSFFTPEDIARNPPDPADRPYAGWLYAGAGLLEEGGGAIATLENAEILIGVVGPAALAEEVQNDYHQLIGAKSAGGWDSQLKNEPGLMVTYERYWRVPVTGTGGLLDVVPRAGATVGNVMTYGQAGGLLRFGNALDADYGPVRIRPALSGTDYFDGAALPKAFGYYVYAGAVGRVVGLNIFLDGNSFRKSPSVEKKNLVADVEGGFAMFFWEIVKVDFSVVRRSEEFDGQNGADVIGTASLSAMW